MNHLPQHKKHIQTQKNINKSNLLPGEIVTFSYVDEDKNQTKPLVLVLNPSFQGNLHGLKLDEIPVHILQQLVNEIRLWYSKRLNEITKLRLPLVKVNTGPPKAFYHRVLSRLLESKLPTINPYREYKLPKITALKVVEYKFDLKQKLDEEAERKRQHELEQFRIQRQQLEGSKS